MVLSSAKTHLARVAGAAVGVAVAVAVLVAAQSSGSRPVLPADVSFTLAPPGTIDASPMPPADVLRATHLVAGGRHEGAGFTLRNQSGTSLRVLIRAEPDSSALDGLVRVRLTSSGKVVADTTLQGLRHGAVVSPRLRRGASLQLRIEAWIPAEVLSGYEGRVVEVSLVVGARRAS